MVEQKGEVRAMLRRLNPDAVVYETTRSNVPLKAVLNTHRFSMTGAEAHEKWLKEAREGEHLPESEEYGIRSFPWRRRKPFHPGRLATLLHDPGALPTSVVRAKGFVWIATRPNFAGVVSFVGHLRNFSQGQAWWAAMERDLWPEGLWEDMKPLWREPHGDRMQEIVIIGSFDKADIETRLDALLLTDEEMQQDWATFVDELPAWEDAAADGKHDHTH